MRAVEKSLFTPHYVAFRAMLVAIRKRAGLTQRDLARRLRRPRSFVSRIEQGERRVDVVEFFWICRACGAPPERTARQIMTEIAKVERAVRRPSRKA